MSLLDLTEEQILGNTPIPVATTKDGRAVEVAALPISKAIQWRQHARKVAELDRVRINSEQRAATSSPEFKHEADAAHEAAFADYIEGVCSTIDDYFALAGMDNKADDLTFPQAVEALGVMMALNDPTIAARLSQVRDMQRTIGLAEKVVPAMTTVLNAQSQLNGGSR